jgi:ribosome biogenesis GTPase
MTGTPERQGRVGIVTAVRPKEIILRAGTESFHTQVPGRLKKGRRETTTPIVVGDRAEFALEGDDVKIVHLVPRTNEIARVDSVRPPRKHVLAANVDQVVCVVAAQAPPLNPRVLDRLLLLGEGAGVAGAICLNKMDLAPGEDPALLRAYEGLGYPVFRTSARTGSGLEAFTQALGGRISLFVGHSGVGKSSLLNELIPGSDLRTGLLSRASGRGVHTTTRVDWIDLPGGGVVLDTPGLRHIRSWGLTPSNLAGCFPEFRDRADRCQFRDCLHREEPGCAVIAGMKDAGEDYAARYDSYRRILDSVEREELW